MDKPRQQWSIEVSRQLYEFAMRFAAGEIPAGDFTDQFMEQWKRERDSLDEVADPDELSERLSSIFCLADLYNPEPGREGYELDEPGLRSEVRRVAGLQP